MKLLVLSYNILSYTAGIAAFSVVFLYYLKSRNKIVLYYFISLCFLLIFMTLLTVEFFFADFLNIYFLMDSFLYRFLHNLSLGALFITIPATVHMLLNIKFHFLLKLAFGVPAFIAAALIFFPYYFTPTGKGIIEIEHLSRLTLYSLLLMVCLYAEILCLFNFRKLDNPNTRVIVRVSAALLGIIIPVAFVQIVLSYILVWLRINYNFLNFLILIWNISSVIVFARLYFLKPGSEIPQDSLIPFLKKYGITGREKDIIRLLAKGLANKQIGGELGIAPRTVKNHIYHIYQKAEVSGRVELLNKIRENN